MNFTDIFIKRPVLATVVSLMILLLGFSSISKMEIREYPKLNSTIITVSTAYPGADADLIAGFITTPLESAIASAEGIDYMSSSSAQGMSTITLNIKLNFDPQVAFTDVMSKVQQTLNQLPPEAQQPVIIKSSDSATPLMYISLSSEHMTPQQITDYATRVVKPQFEIIDGIAKAEILGGSTYSMRVFLNPIKMAALKVSPAEVYTILSKNNFLTAAGNTKGDYIAINVSAETNLTDVDQFKELIIRSSDNNSIIRLRDVARVELGSQNYDSSVTFDSKKALVIALSGTPTANPITVTANARKAFPIMQKQFPPSLEGVIAYDATEYINASIHEVMRTIIEAGLIVVVVIFFFLGSIRSVLIPIITIPLSLVGVCTLMLFLGYSINLLTLLAFVLAIGLVVDDAIVVLENIHRHIEEGKTRLDAALIGAREITIPVIVMTITLASVYAPIGFMVGLTGALFKEFALTLASAVVISGVIALTLSPMMCSRILPTANTHNRFVERIDGFFNRLKDRYKRILHSLLETRAIILLLVATIFIVLPYLYMKTPKETAPDEDKGFFIVAGFAPQYATLDYVVQYTKQYGKIFNSFPETEHALIINSNSPFAALVLKPWNQRQSQLKMKEPLQKKLDSVSGLQTYTIIPAPLPGGGSGTPIQFIIKTTNDFQTLLKTSNALLDAAKKSGLFIYLDNSLKFNKPQLVLTINRSKASDMGLDMQSIGGSLASALSGGYVNYFNLQGRSYQVIPQLERRFRALPEQLEQIYVKTKSGQMAPLSTIASITEKTQPNSITHFQQLNSATIQGVMMPGTSLGAGLEFLEAKANELLPQGNLYDFGGQSRQYIHEGNALFYIFMLSILVIFLVLAAQYESFRDPLIILISVPMSICGALIPLNLGLASINIYTQIGLITLIGLISKHGILIVDFANHLQREKKLNRRAAVEEAASIRLRPILMTTAAMVFGVLPLLAASGPGSISRFDIGLVISTGLVVGTLFTLFVVPTMYTYLASDHRDELE